MMTATPIVDAGTPKFVAKRGTQWLTRDDVVAHLAALLRVEHAAVFLGSGASIGQLGGKTMSQAWDDFKNKSTSSLKWLIDQKFVVPTDAPNIEELLDQIEICRLEWKRAASPSLSEVEAVQADLRRALVRAAVLRESWWADPIPDEELKDLKHHRALLQKLCGARQPGQAAPWVFTSNFDLAVEWAAESLGLAYINGFSGLHNRRFSPHNFDLGFRNVLARGEARFGTYSFYLGKLHGSLTWTDAGPSEFTEQSGRSVWPEIRKFLDGSDGGLRGVLALPGAAKYVTTIGFLMGELFRRFTDFMARPQAMLLVNGYSCSDDHLNRLLATALQNPTLQLVIYSPSTKKDGDTLVVPPTRQWLRNLAALDLPQLTIVFGEDASFQAMVSQLPDPALYDEKAAHIRTLLAGKA